MPKAYRICMPEQDETAEDSDRLPSWMRAKAILNHNWHLMEELAGNRRETIKSLQQFAYVVRPSRDFAVEGRVSARIS